MESTPDAPPRRRRWIRWLALAAGAGLIGLAVLIACLPWILGLPFAQRILATQAARIMAPGDVKFDRVSFGWTRPTRIDGLVLIDPQGDPIVTSPTAHFSWGLRDILLTRPVEMVLDLDHAAVDIERTADGKLDLLETLKPVIQDKPVHTLKIRVPDGKLRFRVEGLNEPFHAEPARIELDLNAYPEPVAWRMNLQRSIPDGEPGRVDIQGHMSRTKRPDGNPEELALTLVADRWPWVFSNDQIRATGGLSGTVDVSDRVERLVLKGDVRVLNLAAAGDLLSGDQLKLDTVTAAWDASRKDGLWAANRLDLDTGFGSVKASGSYPPVGDREARLDATVDLAALARQLPKTLHLREDLQLRKGTAALEAHVRGGDAPDELRISASARLSDLEATHGDRTLVFRDPATLDAKLQRKADGLTLEQLDVKTPFLTATGRGDLDRGIDVSAVIDLDAGSRRLRDWIDLGPVAVAGQGKIDARYQRIVDPFEATANSQFNGLDLKGLPAVDRFHREQLSSTLKATGGATASGLPQSLHDLTVTGRGDGEELSVTATRDQASNAIDALVKGNTRLAVGGKKQTAEATVQSRWDERGASFDPIVLSLTPVVGPGGQFLPSEPSKWSGKGTYDRAKDELRIVANPTEKGTVPPAIVPSELRAGGLAAREAIWLDLNLVGSVAGLVPPAKPDQSRLDGALAGLVQARQHPDGWDLGARVQVRDLASVPPDGDPRVLASEATASVRGKLGRKLDRLDVSEIALVTPYGTVDGSGAILDLKETPRLDLKGNVSPDWKTISDLLAKKVEPNASIAGSARPWRLAGTLPKSAGSDLLATLSGELGVGLEQVDVFGMRLGQAVVTVRAKDGKVLIDPIDATLNSGRLHLEPEVVADKHGKYWLHMGPTSGLLDAVVNDEVSHRVLSFAAPVLDQATRVRGRVSLALNHAYIPLGQGPDVQARIDGDVLFDAVEFMPGPLADQILGVFRQERRPLLVLRDPVSVRILGRRIYQEGLIIPLGDVAVIGIEGWVDLDQNLDLIASFAVVPPRKNIPVLSDLLASTQLQVPIKGTFKKPRLDGEAIKDRFKEMGTNVLDTLIGVGTNGLGRILGGGPQRPAAPRGDFFPPFKPPGDDEAVPAPPVPGGEGPIIDSRKPQRRDAARPADADPPKPAQGTRDDDHPDSLLDRLFRPSQITPEEREMRREERRERRLDKRAERRLRRGLVP